MYNEAIHQDISEKARTHFDYATFWQRTAAVLLDGLIVGLPFAGILYYSFFIKSLPLFLVCSVIMALYKPLMEGIYGATLGKMIMKIKMVDENFNPISLAQSFGKNAIYLISSILSILTGFEMFQNQDFLEAEGWAEIMLAQKMASEDSAYNIISQGWSFLIFFSCMALLFNLKRQTLHDMIAKTFCVKEKLV